MPEAAVPAAATTTTAATAKLVRSSSFGRGGNLRPRNVGVHAQHPVHPSHAAVAAFDPNVPAAPGITRRSVRSALQPAVNPYASNGSSINNINNINNNISSNSNSSSNAASGSPNNANAHRYQPAPTPTAAPLSKRPASRVLRPAYDPNDDHHHDAFKPSYNRALVPPFVPDSEYQRHLSRQAKRKKSTICPIFLAKLLAGFCYTGTTFLVFVGVLIDTQPIFLRGILPSYKWSSENSNKVHVSFATTYSGRLEVACNAYKAALAYFVTGCLLLCYAYNLGWWFKTRYRQYRDIPDAVAADAIPLFEQPPLVVGDLRYGANRLPAKLRRTIVGWVSHVQPWRTNNPKRHRRAEADLKEV